MSKPLAMDLLFIDGPLTLAIIHAPAQEVRDAYTRLGRIIDTYCTYHAHAANPSRDNTPFTAILPYGPNPSLS